MLGSVIQSSSYSYQDQSVQRTMAAVSFTATGTHRPVQFHPLLLIILQFTGVYNGFVHGFIGSQLKRLYFRQLYGKDASTFDADKG